MGSKNAIAERIVDRLPSAPVLYDIFAGGCAITHAALLSRKFARIYANDITDAPQLFAAAARGEYADERRWIRREDFFKLKDANPYVRLCWSFGNNQRQYLYSREVEPWKRALHYARVFGNTSMLNEFGIVSDGSVKDIAKNHEEYMLKYAAWYIRNILKCDEKDVETALKNAGTDLKKKSDELRDYLCNALKEAKLSQTEFIKKMGNFMGRHYFGRSQWAFPTREMYKKMQTFMPALNKRYDELYPSYLQSLERLQSLQSLERLERLQSLQSLESLESLERLERLQSLERLESLQSLERLQSLQSLESLESLSITQKDYRELEFEDGAVVYADPPYKNKEGYLSAFDHEAFYEWCRKRKNLTVISEYQMPEDFTCIAELKHLSKLKCGSSYIVERLFVHESQYERYRLAGGWLFPC